MIFHCLSAEITSKCHHTKFINCCRYNMGLGAEASHQLNHIPSSELFYSVFEKNNPNFPKPPQPPCLFLYELNFRYVHKSECGTYVCILHLVGFSQCNILRLHPHCSMDRISFLWGTCHTSFIGASADDHMCWLLWRMALWTQVHRFLSIILCIYVISRRDFWIVQWFYF